MNLKRSVDRTGWGNCTQQEPVCCQAKCSLLRIWLTRLEACVTAGGLLLRGMHCKSLALGMTAVAQGKVANSSQAWFPGMQLEHGDSVGGHVQAHSQASSGLRRYLRYLSQVTQHLNFCRVLSCCQCLLQGHTRPIRQVLTGTCVDCTPAAIVHFIVGFLPSLYETPKGI